MPSLQNKLNRSCGLLGRLLADYGPDRIALAWTGGKDSTVALALWRSVLAEAGRSEAPKVITLDTGCKFPEIVAFRDHWAEAWGLDLTIVRPDPADIPPRLAQDPLACCKALKIDPLRRAVAAQNLAVLVTGIRADEHPDRAAPGPLVAKRDPDYQQANPLLDWTEMDVWAFTISAGLPFCELYAKGYRSLGCVPCTRPGGEGGGERSGRDARKEGQMATLRALGYF